MPTGSFIWGCFEATSKLKLVIVTLFVQQQLQPQQPHPPPPPWLVKTSGVCGHLILVREIYPMLTVNIIWGCFQPTSKLKLIIVYIVAWSGF